ncbi:hypothetical protein PCANC_09856 [Puccinia coronata f. sp. avenae]|uniref:Uncharacterized protein n=1 Tax=Puccinia coronata f. sp. avenae TaxID=200324 RepID=A0A2N5T3Y8_9BASI|nr:hypothetical protein PCANC_09856 [Puccinia coronata f. sp. avenae]
MSSPYVCATSRLILGVVGKFMGVVFPSPFIFARDVNCLIDQFHLDQTSPDPSQKPILSMSSNNHQEQEIPEAPNSHGVTHRNKFLSEPVKYESSVEVLLADGSNFNKWKRNLNRVVGLCLGHASFFNDAA